MTLEDRIVGLAQAVGADMKALSDAIAALSNTPSASINDTTTQSDATWSSHKIDQEIDRVEQLTVAGL
jgi:hypothetical protein